MNISETLARAGIVVGPKTVMKEYAESVQLPSEYHYDFADGRGPCTDSYSHDVSAPEHFGAFIVVRETEHFCLGGTKGTIHVAPAASDNPHGGDIPVLLCRILRTTFGGHTPTQVWAMNSEQAKSKVRGSWVTANTVAQAVMKGELEEQWLPEGSQGGAGGMWLREALQAAYQRGVNPLPMVRQMFANCSWEWSQKPCSRTDRGIYPVYETGDVVFASSVKGGWVKATLTGERTNSPL
jgi:hypothetical protein